MMGPTGCPETSLTTNLCHTKSQNSKELNYTRAEAWNTTQKVHTLKIVLTKHRETQGTEQIGLSGNDCNHAVTTHTALTIIWHLGTSLRSSLIHVHYRWGISRLTPLWGIRRLTPLQDGSCGTHVTHFIQLYPQPLYRVSQEERTKLREGVPYVKLYRYNPKHLYPKLNGYGDNGKRSLKLDSCYTLTDCQIHIETDRNMWFL